MIVIAEHLLKFNNRKTEVEQNMFKSEIRTISTLKMRKEIKGLVLNRWVDLRK